MKCVIPLAGPDFYDARHGAKALWTSDGTPLLERALASRPWFANGRLCSSDLVFVLREGDGLAQVEGFLRERFAGASHVWLSRGTTGALASAAAGASLLLGSNEVLVVDLVDILYACEDVSTWFTSDPELAGVIPFFESTLPRYSYLELRESVVTRTREKEVISTHASAGTYFFRDAATFFQAAAGEFARRADRYRHFVCPSYNALIESGRKILGAEVHKVSPISWPPE